MLGTDYRAVDKASLALPSAALTVELVCLYVIVSWVTVQRKFYKKKQPKCITVGG